MSDPPRIPTAPINRPKHLELPFVQDGPYGPQKGLRYYAASSGIGPSAPPALPKAPVGRK